MQEILKKILSKPTKLLGLSTITLFFFIILGAVVPVTEVAFIVFFSMLMWYFSIAMCALYLIKKVFRLAKPEYDIEDAAQNDEEEAPSETTAPKDNYDEEDLHDKYYKLRAERYSISEELNKEYIRPDDFIEKYNKLIGIHEELKEIPESIKISKEDLTKKIEILKNNREAEIIENYNRYVSSSIKGHEEYADKIKSFSERESYIETLKSFYNDLRKSVLPYVYEYEMWNLLEVIESKEIQIQESINKIDNKYETKKLMAQGRAEFDAIMNVMTGIEFEHFCVELLLKNGFDSAYATQASNDYGVDVIATKDNVKYAIQCKLYSSHIGNKAVQEVSAGKEYYKCHVAVVMTNNYFTANAITLAQATNVLLWDGDKLRGMYSGM